MSARIHARLPRAPLALLLGLTVALALAPSAAAAPKTTRAGVSSAEAEADAGVHSPALSANGRFVVFHSPASNLVDGDTNGQIDVFVRNRRTGMTFRVSLGPGGVEGDGESYGAGVSADGRFVVFGSRATNLVAGDTNATDDIFLRDRMAGTTTRVSLTDGDAEADGPSYSPVVSPDGRLVAFESSATDLVAGDTSGDSDVFIRNRNTGTTTRLSVSSAEGEGNGASFVPSLSTTGRYVAFFSEASNLVGGDTNAAEDAFVRDRKKGTTRRVSLRSGGGQGNGDSSFASISGGGRYVAFDSDATNLVRGDGNALRDVFVRDLWTGITRLVSRRAGGGLGNGKSQYAKISADGRFVAFETYATNFVPRDTNSEADIILRDRKIATTKRMSRSTAGAGANFGSYYAAISADGRFVTFESDATNLVQGDGNAATDVFVRGPLR